MNEDEGSGTRPGDNADPWAAQAYAILRALARRHLAGERARHTLNTTALVHEAWLALAGHCATPDARARFHAYAAVTMRNILVDHARRRLADKRGGGQERLDLEQVEIGVEDSAAELVALDAALARLAAFDARLSQVVELRFFAGLSVEETAAMLDIVPRSVVRDWARARAFLREAMA
ncbi:MAG: sigma-70 family RNA polymerase sigma factor [Dokdonella sp.]|uniref:ECF-type sigma factor n=1 Tax=Dokdonella sp. TaxID=2291710 RepID=UPI0025C68D74|nr:ECF-type sigma factor [Dokdonella sp.]MBX3700496.1 sigma-70 family RNA polymerase sigma factor [Dokdonella sp.]